jgi:hypothetical protein
VNSVIQSTKDLTQRREGAEISWGSPLRLCVNRPHPDPLPEGERTVGRAHLGALQRGNCFICSHPSQRKKELGLVSGWHISERHSGGAAGAAGGEDGEDFGSLAFIEDRRMVASVRGVGGWVMGAP